MDDDTRFRDLIGMANRHDVVFYPINHPFGRNSDRERFSSLERLIRVYRMEEMDEVDWNPPPLAASEIRLRVVEGFFAMTAAQWHLPPVRPLEPIAPPEMLPCPI